MSSLIEQIIAAIVALVVLAGVSYWSYEHIQKIGYKKAVTEYTLQMAAQKKLTDTATALLQSQLDKAKQDQANEIKSIDAQHDALVSSLRTRLTRAQAQQRGPSAVAPVGSSCDGSQLYRDDAEFLAGQAALADKVKSERDYYYGRYEAARELLQGQSSVSGQQGSVPNTEPVSGTSVQQ